MAEPKVRRAATDLAKREISVFGPVDEATGKQSVVKIISPDPSKWDANLRDQMAIYGFSYVAQNGYNRLDNPTHEDVIAALEKTEAALIDGSWTPGRTFSGGEPDDITLALAEYYGVPVHVMEKDIEERVHLDEHGNPVKDKKGRNKRVFTKAVLDHIANEPQIKPIMARLAKERAERLAREAKSGSKSAPTGALDLFAGRFNAGGTPATAEAEAAN